MTIPRVFFLQNSRASNEEKKLDHDSATCKGYISVIANLPQLPFHGANTKSLG